MNHLIDEGLIANVGNLASKVAKFRNLTIHILKDPCKSFLWTLKGGTKAIGHFGYVNGRAVVVFVARSGPYAGKVVSAIVPDLKQLAQWGLMGIKH